MKNLRFFRIMYVISLSLMLFTITSLYSFYSTMKKDVVFKLKGEDKVEMEVFSEYTDHGAKALACLYNIYQGISKEIKTDNEVDNNKVGEYFVSYHLNYNDIDYEIKRKVIVKDNTSPTILLVGSNEKTICPNQKYVEEGYTASDNYDGDVTNLVSVNTDSEGITYSVTDTSGNSVQEKRIIKYEDTEKPTIRLSEDNTIYLEIGSNYKESGYQAVDNCEGDITNRVVVTNNINNMVAGTYYVNYSVSDSNGNSNSRRRKIIVYDLKTKNLNDYVNNLNSYIAAKGYRVSLGYFDLNSGYTYSHRASTVYYGASLIKTLDALYIYENNQVNDYTRELVKKAITVSDNVAHKTLVDIIGFNNLKKYGNSLGATYTLIGGDKYGSTNVNDQIAYMKKLYSFIRESNYGEELRSYFTNNYYNYLSFDGLPTITHKYGDYAPNFHDVAVVWDEHPYVIVVLSNGGYLNRKDIFLDISKRIYGLHKVIYS